MTSTTLGGLKVGVSDWRRRLDRCEARRLHRELFRDVVKEGFGEYCKEILDIAKEHLPSSMIPDIEQRLAESSAEIYSWYYGEGFEHGE